MSLVEVDAPLKTSDLCSPQATEREVPRMAFDARHGKMRDRPERQGRGGLERASERR
jgi:hypothetical protein